jgi:hypothetical protein
VMLEHSVFILARAITKYGETDFASKSIEEKKSFVENLPGIAVPKLIAKYHLFEKSLDKALSDPEKIKN